MTQVIKVGGNELDDPTFVKGLVRTVKALPDPPVLVHGGGKEIRSLQERLGLEPQYIDGLRVTDQESLAVVQMVLAGRINKRLVASLTAEGVDAFGMSGVDRGAVKAVKLEHPAGDLGWVGRIVAVRTEVFDRLLDDGITAVLSPICWGSDGSMFNVNADHVALAVASALGAETLVFVSNVPGVMAGDQLVEHINSDHAETLIADGVVFGGMVPKVRSALEAVAAGVNAVCITNLEGLAKGVGTVVTASPQPPAPGIQNP
jgi:acetylglutamate kinase